MSSFDAFIYRLASIHDIRKIFLLSHPKFHFVTSLNDSTLFVPTINNKLI